MISCKTIGCFEALKIRNLCTYTQNTKGVLPNCGKTPYFYLIQYIFTQTKRPEVRKNTDFRSFFRTIPKTVVWPLTSQTSFGLKVAFACYKTASGNQAYSKAISLSIYFYYNTPSSIWQACWQLRPNIHAS